MNLVELIKGQLSGEVLEKLAGMTGGGVEGTRSAVDAGVPVLLSGLDAMASSPEGAEKLAGAMQGLDSGSLGDLAGMFGGGSGSGGGGDLIAKGMELLRSALGEGGLKMAVGVLEKLTGMSGEALTKLLGSLLPVVLGMVAKQLGGGDRVSAASVSRLFEEQRGNIREAMPMGLGSLNLGGGGGSGAGMNMDAALKTAAGAATVAVKVFGFPAWLFPAAGAVLVLGAGWMLMNQLTLTGGPEGAGGGGGAAAVGAKGEDGGAVVPAADVARESAPEAKEEMTGRVLVEIQADALRGILESIGSAEDAAGASARLKGVLAGLDELAPGGGRADSLAGPIAATARKLDLEEFRGLADRALAIPGVREAIGEDVEGALSRLEGLRAEP